MLEHHFAGILSQQLSPYLLLLSFLHGTNFRISVEIFGFLNVSHIFQNVSWLNRSCVIYQTKTCFCCYHHQCRTCTEVVMTTCSIVLSILQYCLCWESTDSAFLNFPLFCLTDSIVLFLFVVFLFIFILITEAILILEIFPCFICWTLHFTVCV